MKRQGKINPQASPYEEPSIFVYADFDAMIHQDGTHLPICVSAESSESNECLDFCGEDCTHEFLEWLDQLAYGTEEESRHFDDYQEIICIFHNLKGYDAIFLQHQLLQEGRRFDFMIPNGTKNLSLQVGNVNFKNSMCFVPMPLSSFTSTFASLN